MLLYEDIINGSEMFSDAFPMKIVDDVVYEVDCSMVTIKEGQVDIGANASAEEAEEVLEDGAITVNNVISTSRLESTSFDKKSYLLHLKGYMKAVKAKLAETKPDQVEAFEKGAQAYAKKVIANFKDYEFYVGDQHHMVETEGMVALLNYREDGITPYLTFWKHGLKEVKL